MKETTKLQRVVATPELLLEMETLQIYGGDVVVNPYYTNPCGTNLNCNGTYCGYCSSDCNTNELINCRANCNTNCTILCNHNTELNCNTNCSFPCNTFTSRLCSNS